MARWTPATRLDAQAAREPAPPWLRSIPSWILAPTDVIEEPHPRRQARIHAITLVVLLPLAVLSTAIGVAQDWAAIRNGGATLEQTWIAMGATVALVGAFLLLRAGRPRWAATATVTVTFLAVWALWYVDIRAGATGADTLYFLGIPILLASLLLTFWRAVVVLALNLGSALATPAWTGLTAPNGLITFVGVTSVLALTLSALHYRDTRVLQNQAYLLSEAERHRRESINTLAHDLASPLSPIKMQLYALKARPDARRLAPALAMIHRNIAHVKALLSDWKEVVEGEAGRMRMRIEPVDLGALIQEVGGALQATARGQGVDLRITEAGGLWIHADALRMRELLYNLVTNAIKYSPNGGRIDIMAQATSGGVRVGVRDSGIGIEAADISRLFRPFSQVHDTRKVRVKSTGLGLYISKQVVEAHGGRIWATSAGMGKGAEFWFELPRHDPSTHRPSDPAPARRGGPRMWNALTDPSDALEDPAARRTARFLSSLLLAAIVVGIVSFAYTTSEEPLQPFSTASNAVMVAGILALCAAYAVSRTRSYDWGVWMLLLTVTVGVWSMWYATMTEAGAHAILYFAPYQVMLAVPFLRFRQVLALATGGLLLLVAIPPAAASWGTAALDAETLVSLAISYVLFAGLAVAAFGLTKQNQEQLVRQAQAIDMADAARAHMARRIGDQLEQPVDAIAKLVPQPEDPLATPAALEQDLEQAQALVDDVEHLIDDLKELARLEAGRIQVAATSVHLADLHAQAVQVANAMQRGKAADLPLEGESRRVLVDPNHTVKAFVHLIRFAIRQAGGSAVRAHALPADQRTAWSLLVPTAVGPTAAQRQRGHWAAPQGASGDSVDLGIHVARRILEVQNVHLDLEWLEEPTRLAIRAALPHAPPSADTQ